MYVIFIRENYNYLIEKSYFAISDVDVQATHSFELITTTNSIEEPSVAVTVKECILIKTLNRHL